MLDVGVTDMDGRDILKLPMPDSVVDDGDGPTIGDYLRKTMKALITEGETFSGKRPLGNSDWDYQLIIALINGGALKGKIAEYDEPIDFEWPEFWAAMFVAIDAMGES